MTYGKLYHEDNICFGPAMIKAYNLEQEAIYPRIIVDNLAIEKGLEQLGLDVGKITDDDINEVLITENGISYIDFLYSALEEFEEINEYTDYLENIRKNLIFHFKK